MGRIRNRIKEYRARYGLTQEQLANAVGVRREIIVHMENDRHSPSLDLAFRIVRTLRAGVEDIFFWDDEKS